MARVRRDPANTVAPGFAPMTDRNQETPDPDDRADRAADFDREWRSLLPRLRRITAGILGKFGDVEDQVDDVLDESRRRCCSAVERCPINRTFMIRVTRRVALSKHDALGRRTELLLLKHEQEFGPGGSRNPARLADFYHLRWLILFLLDSEGRRVMLEMVRQIQENGCISYEEMGRALGCSTRRARLKVERCAEQARKLLSLDGNGNHHSWRV